MLYRLECIIVNAKRLFIIHFARNPGTNLFLGPNRIILHLRPVIMLERRAYLMPACFMFRLLTH